MSKAAHPLRLATAALQGRLPPEGAWPGVLEIANRGWLCPALYVSLRDADRLKDIPLPVREYLGFIHSRNCDRNRRLRTQLLEAVRALNAAGIEPILLKGAIDLFAAAADDIGTRMLSDLDIGIATNEMPRATAALGALGYRRTGNGREMARPDDAGVIEFHDRPSARSAAYLSADLRACSPIEERDGATARIPTATARALHLIVHDMIKEGDYWTFRIDLRHLHDLAGLARSREGIDWQHLCAVLADRRARAALVVQARALEDLFGVVIPHDLRPGRQEECRHIARLVCASGGPAASVLRLTGNLSRGVHQISDGYSWRGGRQLTRQVYKRLASRGTGSRV